MVTSERSCRSVKDPNGCKRLVILSQKVLQGCERPVVLSEKFCMGVRDPRYYPKSSIWVLETHGVIRKVLLPKRKHTVMFIT